MRVINEGHIKEFKANCSKCGAQIGFYKPEIKQMHRSNKIIHYINCPICAAPIIFFSQDVPEI